jgi:hypothetical protein
MTQDLSSVIGIMIIIRSIESRADRPLPPQTYETNFSEISPRSRRDCGFTADHHCDYWHTSHDGCRMGSQSRDFAELPARIAQRRIVSFRKDLSNSQWAGTGGNAGNWAEYDESISQEGTEFMSKAMKLYR